MRASHVVFVNLLADRHVSIWDVRVVEPGGRLLGAHQIQESCTDSQLTDILCKEDKRLALLEAVVLVGLPQQPLEQLANRVKHLPFWSAAGRQASSACQVVFIDDPDMMLHRLPFLQAQDVEPIDEDAELSQLTRIGVPHHIIGNVYLGDYMCATSLDVLRSLGIGHVINASNHFGNKFEDNGIVYLDVNVDDYPFEDIASHFQRTYDYIEEARGPVLVHCAAGVSRSASIVIAYLMQKHRLALDEAITLTHARRSLVSPNQGFLSQLVTYEQNLGVGVGNAYPEFLRMEDLLKLPAVELLEEYALGHKDTETGFIWQQQVPIGRINSENVAKLWFDKGMIG
jgi:hypothetical protein